MNSFALCPLQPGYNPTFANNMLEQELRGGFARQRRQFVNNTHTVDVAVLLNNDMKQEYFWAFWRKHVEDNPQPFLWKLKIGDINMTTYECQFVAGSLQEQERSGKKYKVSFSVRCKPNRTNSDFDATIVEVWESKDPARLLALLERLVNVEMPEALGDI